MVSYWTILLRLAIALLLGSLVGLERERKERGAGMRTVALVTLGSTLFTIVSAYGFIDLVRQLHLSLDPTRIASYIVAGVGFLGAGTIFMSRDREKVKGLTTAASIWVMAAVGIACGAGLLLEAVTTTLLTLIVLIVLSMVERRLMLNDTSGSQHISIEAKLVTGDLISLVYETCARNELAIEKLRIHHEEGTEVIDLTCQVAKPSALTSTLADLQALPGVYSIQTHQSEAGESTSFLTRRTNKA